MKINVIKLLQQLIGISSVNPEGITGTEAVGELKLAHFLQSFFEQHGATVTLEEVLPDRPNLIARFAPLDGRPRVLFGPHLDTVGVQGMTIDPFSGELRDGKIWGRGASDTKGPMAAMIVALLQHADHLKNAPIALDFVAFMGEETNQWGSIHFAKHHAHEYQFAFVGEPTSMQIVNQTKGALWAKMAVKGKAAHSSQPQLGDNAIVKAANCIILLQKALEQAGLQFPHPVLGLPTCNIGVIQGGTRSNIIPDYVTMEIDVRTTPALYQQEGNAIGLLKNHIQELKLPLEILHFHEKPPMETPAHHPVILAIQELNQSLSCVGAPWFSDASHLANAGIPSVCLGPGSIDQAHTKDEYISEADLIQGVEIFNSIIQKLLKFKF